LMILGVGLKPDVQLSFDTNNPFFMGCVLAKDHVEKSFQVSEHLMRTARCEGKSQNRVLSE
jgi:hypothetical protein